MFVDYVLLTALIGVVLGSESQLSYDPEVKRPIMTSTCESCYYSYNEGDLSYECYFQYCRDEAYNRNLLFSSSSDPSLSNCGTCAYFIDSAYYQCAYANCKSEILNILETLYGSKNQETLETCSKNCYYQWYYYNYNYDDCINAYCKTEGSSENLIKLSMVENNKKTSLSSCDACYYYYISDTLESCVYIYCKNEILDIKKLSNKGIENAQKLYGGCHDCGWYYYADRLDEYNECVAKLCKNQDKIQLKQLNIEGQKNNDGGCHDCGWYYYAGRLDEYYECTAKLCKKQEIVNAQKLTDEGQDTAESSLGGCHDCAWYYYADMIDEYNDCTAKLCKNDEVAYMKKLNDQSEDTTSEIIGGCHDCAWYYYAGRIDEYNECTVKLCKNNDVVYMKKLNADTTDEVIGGCHDCGWYYYADRFDEYYECVEKLCKEEVQGLADKYFEGKLSFVSVRPEILYTNCELCDYYYTGEAWEDCVYYYCKNEILDPEMLIRSGSTNKDEAQTSRCTTDCYYNYIYGFFTYDEYYVCYTKYCKNEVISLYKEINASNFIKDKKESELYTCNGCLYAYSDYNFNCLWCYKEAVLDKKALFANNAVAKDSTCYSCSTVSDYDYYNCVYYSCKDEIVKLSQTVAIKNPLKLYEKVPIKSVECSTCTLYSDKSSSLSSFDCCFENCKEEAVEKNVLFSSVPDSSKITSCENCYYYDDDSEYVNCVYWYCKDEIVSKVQNLYESGQDMESSCQGTCYFDWYFSNSEYFTCLLSCKDVSIDNLLRAPEFVEALGGSQLDCLDVCVYYTSTSSDYSDCILYHCKDEVVEKLVASISENSSTELNICDYCEISYNKGQLSYSNYINYITLHNCIDISENTKKLLKKDSVKMNYCGDCWDYYYVGYLTLDEYKYCVQLYCKTDQNLENTNILLDQTELINTCSACFNSNTQSSLSENKLCISRNCKSELKSLVNQNSIKTSTFIEKTSLMSYCQQCYNDYENDGYYDCIYYYCKDVIEEVTLQAKNNLKEKSKQDLTRCDNCYYFYDQGIYSYSDYSVCYYWYCKDEVLEQADLYKEKLNIIEMKSGNDDGKCFYYAQNKVQDMDYSKCYEEFYMGENVESEEFVGKAAFGAMVMVGGLACAMMMRKRNMHGSEGYVRMADGV